MATWQAWQTTAGEVATYLERVVAGKARRFRQMPVESRLQELSAVWAQLRQVDQAWEHADKGAWETFKTEYPKLVERAMSQAVWEPHGQVWINIRPRFGVCLADLQAGYKRENAERAKRNKAAIKAAKTELETATEPTKICKLKKRIYRLEKAVTPRTARRAERDEIAHARRTGKRRAATRLDN